MEKQMIKAICTGHVLRMHRVYTMTAMWLSIYATNQNVFPFSRATGAPVCAATSRPIAVIVAIYREGPGPFVANEKFKYARSKCICVCAPKYVPAWLLHSIRVNGQNCFRL